MSTASVPTWSDVAAVEIPAHYLRPLRDATLVSVEVPDPLVGALRERAFEEFSHWCEQATAATEPYERSTDDAGCAAVLSLLIRRVSLVLDQLGWVAGGGLTPGGPAEDWIGRIRGHRGMLLELTAQGVGFFAENIKNALEDFEADGTPEEIRGRFHHVETWLTFYETVRNAPPAARTDHEEAN